VHSRQVAPVVQNDSGRQLVVTAPLQSFYQYEGGPDLRQQDPRAQQQPGQERMLGPPQYNNPEQYRLQHQERRWHHQEQVLQERGDQHHQLPHRQQQQQQRPLPPQHQVRAVPAHQVPGPPPQQVPVPPPEPHQHPQLGYYNEGAQHRGQQGDPQAQQQRQLLVPAGRQHPPLGPALQPAAQGPLPPPPKLPQRLDVQVPIPQPRGEAHGDPPEPHPPAPIVLQGVVRQPPPQRVAVHPRRQEDPQHNDKRRAPHVVPPAHAQEDPAPVPPQQQTRNIFDLQTKEDKKQLVLQDLGIAAGSQENIRAVLEVHRRLSTDESCQTVYETVRGILGIRAKYETPAKAIEILAKALAGTASMHVPVLVYVHVCALATTFIKRGLAEASRKWQGALALHTMMSHAARMMSLCILRLSCEPFHRISQFARIPRISPEFDLGRRIQTVYVLCSLGSPRFYVGRSVMPLLRYEAHLRASATPGRHDEFLYKHLRAVGCHNYVLVPLLYCNSISEADSLETRVIRRLSPSLNTQKTPFPSQKMSSTCSKRRRPVKAVRDKLEDAVFRRKRRKTTDTSQLVWYSVSNNVIPSRSGPALDIMLDSVPNGATVRIKRARDEQSQDLTNWRKIRRTFGQSAVREVGGRDRKLRDENNSDFSEIIVTVKKDKRDRAKEHMRDILTKPNESWPMLFSLSLSELLRLLVLITERKSSNLVMKAAERVQTVLLKKYFVTRVPVITLRVPYARCQRKSLIRKAFLAVLDTTDIQSEVYAVIEKKMRVVTTSRSSLGDIIFNFRKAARVYDPKCEPDCVCNTSHGEHAILTPEQLPPFEKLVLTQNSKNLPHPSTINLYEEGCKAIRESLPALEKILNQRERNRKEYGETGQYDPCSCSLTRLFDSKDKVMYPVLSLIDEYAQEIPIAEEVPGFLQLKNVIRTKALLSEWIRMPFDKNPGKIAVLCPRRYWNALTKMFVLDTEHYEVQSNVKPEEYVNSWKAVYDDKQWERLGRFFPKGKIPEAYALPKFKDFNRYRVIISFYSHPLRQVLRTVQRAFLFCIRNVPEERYDIDRTSDLLSRVRSFEQDLKDAFGKNTEFLPFSKDVKEMFTRLPHDAIEKAGNFVLQKISTERRRKNVRVPRQKSDKCTFGTSTNAFESCTVTFADIMEVLRFDLASAVFSLGNLLFTQKEGAPIGGILSTAMAIAVCFHAEYEFHASLGQDRSLFRQGRYTDDTWGIVAYDKTDIATLVRARNLVDRYQTSCYPPQLTLEDEKIDNGTFEYLEATLHVSKNKIQCNFNNKNYPSLVTTGCQKFYRLQHAKSYSPTSSKKGVIHARLLAIMSYSNTSALLIKSTAEFVYELESIGYSRRFVRKCCNKAYAVTGKKAWKKASMLLKVP